METPEANSTPQYPPSAPPPQRGRRLLVTVAAAAILLGGGSGAAAWSILAATHSPAGQGPIQAVTQSLPAGSSRAAAPTIQSQAPTQVAGSLDLTSVTDRVSPFVVDINTVFVTGSSSGSAAGTGIILTSGGEVLTNNHVVEGATSIKVTIAGHSASYQARVLGVDPTADVALIQVEGVSGLPVATLADSKTLSVGQEVAALGNALGLGGAPRATAGSITALEQSITAGGSGTPEQLTGLIESDAQIAPGDSGGPLVNAAGQVVGMTTAGQSSGRRVSTSPLGYAIPTDQILPIVNQIREGRASAQVIIGTPGYIGVQVTDLTSALASRLGLTVSSGAAVAGVVAGSPAEAAGLTPGAVINSVGGASIGSTQALGAALHTHAAGDRVKIGWVDQRGTHTATLTLTSGPAV